MEKGLDRLSAIAVLAVLGAFAVFLMLGTAINSKKTVNQTTQQTSCTCTGLCRSGPTAVYGSAASLNDCVNATIQACTARGDQFLSATCP